MSRILNAAKLDYFASKSMLRMVSMLVIIGIIIGVIAHGPDYMMMFIMVFGVTSAGSIFSVHERSHSDKLYGILPLTKTQMILGRYLYALVIGIIYIVVAGVLGLILTYIMGVGFDPLVYWATLALGFAYFCFATGVAYPIYFKFTFAKAYVFTMIPMYIIAVAFLIVTRRADLASTLGSIVTFFMAHVYLAPIFGVVLGLILMGVSLAISNVIYTRKEI